MDSRRSARSLVAALAAAIAVVLTACSGGAGATPGTTGGAGAPGATAPGAVTATDAPSTDVSSGTVTSGGPVPAGLVDPCTLLSTDAAARIADGTVLDGIRDPEEDGTYVQCIWRNDRAFLAGETDFAPPITVFLAPTSDEVKANLEAAIGSGNMDALDGTAADRAAITSADLGTAGVSGASGIKGAIFFRVTCWSPQVPAGGATKPSKEMCSEAAAAAAAALP